MNYLEDFDFLITRVMLFGLMGFIIELSNTDFKEELIFVFFLFMVLDLVFTFFLFKKIIKGSNKSQEVKK